MNSLHLMVLELQPEFLAQVLGRSLKNLDMRGDDYFKLIIKLLYVTQDRVTDQCLHRPSSHLKRVCMGALLHHLKHPLELSKGCRSFLPLRLLRNAASAQGPCLRLGRCVEGVWGKSVGWEEFRVGNPRQKLSTLILFSLYLCVEVLLHCLDAVHEGMLGLVLVQALQQLGEVPILPVGLGMLQNEEQLRIKYEI